MQDQVSTASPQVSVGSCPRCGVSFSAPVESQALGRAILHAHETVCPGGSRDFEVVAPLDALDGA
jgi:hypothetical protein